MGAREIAMPAVAADPQETRTAHAERFGARARRLSKAHKLDLQKQSARRVCCRRPILSTSMLLQPDSGKNSRPEAQLPVRHHQARSFAAGDESRRASARAQSGPSFWWLQLRPTP